MKNSHLLLRTAADQLPTLAQRLQPYLRGLDVRITPVGPTQALLREHLVRALEAEYGARQLLEALGASPQRWLDEQQVQALLAARDGSLLPPRGNDRQRSGGLDWHLHTVRAPQAWALLGGPDGIAWGHTRLAQIDTGYTRHPAFGFRQGVTPWLDEQAAASFLPSLPNGREPFPSPEVGPGIDPLTGLFDGHGTRIGAAICGHDPQASGGAFYGAAPQLPLLPIRITDAVVINQAQDEFLQAVQHGLAWGASVFNVSLGLFPNTPTKALRRALDLAYEAGAIMVCAAGQPVKSVRDPAALRRSIAVAGSTAEDLAWSESAHGTEVDHCAPAAGLRRAQVKRGHRFSYANGGDGTSYATALTSGAAALWLAHRGADIQARYGEAWQRAAAFRTLMQRTARRPAVWNDQAFGAGILDIAALLTAPLPRVDDLQKEAPA